MQPLSADCDTYVGPKNNKGYGMTRHEGRAWLAHRLAYFKANGPIPSGMDVCHRCDNPGCIRPAHLFLGTRKENMADCARKGRIPRGEQRPGAKLTADDVRDIRVMANALTRASIAALYDVSPGTISKVVSGDRWSHVAA
jgi:hypothetical protein